MGTELSRIVGLRVKRAREVSNLAQRQLAERIDRTKEAVSNIERGVNLPGIDTLQAICDVTKIPLTALVETIEDDKDTQDQRAQLNAIMGKLTGPDRRLLVAIAQAMLERT
ncbi:helix-turn-helix domain-containing protein [Methylobacterium mesophilicum]